MRKRSLLTIVFGACVALGVLTATWAAGPVSLAPKGNTGNVVSPKPVKPPKLPVVQEFVDYEYDYPAELAPAAEGNVVLFVELSSLALADAGVAPNRENSYRQNLRQEQAAFRAEAAENGVGFSERHSFEVLLNGISLEIAKSDLAALKNLDSVGAVYPVYRIMGGGTPVAADAPDGTTPANVTVTELTGVPQAHAAGYTGAGTVIGILDGGIDYNHPALGGPGFPNAKVIGGYDFADDDPDPFDDQYGSVHDHGTHVSGIAAGSDDNMVGVAPDAKIRFYRVFGTTNPGGTEDILIAAMEQAADDGCDVINMSLGQNQYQIIQNGVLARAADKLVKRDVVVVVAAGNSGTAGPFRPSTPAIGKSVVAVAAAYNTDIASLAFRLSNGTDMGYRLMYGSQPPAAGTLPITDFGTASCSPIPEGVSYEGQAVMVRRGSFSCRPYIQVNLLAAAGAEAVIWWQYSSFNPTTWPSQTTGSSTVALDIPAVVFRQFDAEEIATAGAGATLTWGHYLQDPALFPGVTTFFSSWGPTYDLVMKPDVMGPGGYIFSTIPGHSGSYGLMDGTSMSSPHVAGIAALMRSANPRLQAHEVRDLLIGTAVPSPYNFDPAMGLHPVAQQGAGFVDAMAAIQAGAKAKPSKISLGDLNGVMKSETITIENKTNADVTYMVSHVPALSAQPPFVSAWIPTTDAATVTLSPGMLLIPAEGQANLTATFKEPSTVPGGTILSGWIELAPVGGGKSFRVPYLGLKGDYHELPAINPKFAELNPTLGNPFQRPESRPSCTGPPPTQAACCRQPEPGSCGFSVGSSTPLTLDYTNGDKYDDVAFVGLSQGFPMLRKYRVRVLNEHGQTVAYAIDRYTGGLSLELFEYWPRNSGAGTGLDFAQWHGLLEDGSPAPSGTYYMKLEMDKYQGDGNSYPDFETWTSPAITVIR